MSNKLKLAFVAALWAFTCTGLAQQLYLAAGPVSSDTFRTTYIRIDGSDEGLLYEPVTPGPNARIGLVLSHSDGNTFNSLPVVEMAKRGYRVLAVNHHGDSNDMVVFGQALSRAIGYFAVPYLAYSAS